MTNNTFIKSLLILQTLGLFIYTCYAFQTEGISLFSVLFTNLKSLGWSGQFNVDLLCYSTLSGIWIMWRNKFAGSAILIGVLAMSSGMLIFAPYLLWLIGKEKGDLKRVIVGE